MATDDKTREEIIGKAGIFVDNNNIEGYASALKKALETDFGDIPRNQAEKFSWDKVILEYEKLFIRMRINKIC
ncbi:MAG: glycosyl transferase, group 1 [uncultured bacterium]|nr:MAG: glycosyl transferase, group 1 [uncultured bacterium]